jgi:DNA-binding Lrp family transcriptional regulator
MSLKNIGKVGNEANLIKNFSGLSDISATLGLDGSKAFDTISQSLKGLDIDAASKKLQDLKLNPSLSSEILTVANTSEFLKGSTEEIAAGISKVGEAGSNVGTLGDAFSGLAATIGVSTTTLGIFTGVLGAGVAAFAIYSAYQKHIQTMVANASSSANELNQRNTSLKVQISDVENLKTALASGSLSEEQAYQAKSQLLNIQNSLVSTYGKQAANIDLVNGSLEREIGLMNNLSVEDGNKFLNTNKEGIEESTTAMTKEHRAYLGSFTSIEGTEESDGLQKIIAKYEDSGIKSFTDPTSGVTTIHFKGDVSQAEETLNNFMTDVRNLADNTGDNYDFLDGIGDYTSSELQNVNKILDTHQDTYNSALQADMISKGLGDDMPATVYNDYINAVKDYNTALSGGDTTAISSAKAAFDEVQSSVSSVLKSYPEYQPLFDDVGNSLNDMAVKSQNFTEALNSSDLSGTISQFKDIKSTDLKNIDFTDDISSNGESALKSVVDKAIELGIVSDSSAESISVVVDLLEDMGLTGTKSATFLSESFTQASTSIKTATSNIALLNGMMSESASGSGLSLDSVTSFRDMFGENAEQALEKTANGYHINREALAELQKQQNESTKSEYLSALSDQYEQLNDLDSQIAKGNYNGDSIDDLLVQREGIEQQITSLKDLQIQYEAAGSAYQQWQNAVSGNEEGDMYDSIYSGKGNAQDLYDKGLVGTNEFKSYTDLLSNQDLSSASTAEVVAAYELLGQTIQGTSHSALEFFEEGKVGTDTFLETISQLNSDWVKMNEDGTWSIDFDKSNDQDIADALGLDVEAVQSIMRKLSDYGYEINLDQPILSLEEMKLQAQSAKESLEGMNDNTLSDIDLDSSSYMDVTDNISEVRDYIESINESDLEPEVKTDMIEEANQILEYLVEKQEEINAQSIEITVNEEELDQKIQDAKSALEEFRNEDGEVVGEGAQEAIDNLQTLLLQKEQLNAPIIMTVDANEVGQSDTELGAAITKVQEYQAAVQELNAQIALKSLGVDVDTSGAHEKVNGLAAEIQGLNPEILAKLGVDTSNEASIQASVNAITPEVLIKAGVDASAINNGQLDNKEPVVKYKVDSLDVDLWKAPNKPGTVTYSPDTSLLPTSFYTTAGVKIHPKFNGTAHANGSSHTSGSSYASGNWGVKKNESTLVGELGQEIVVRGSQFNTVGDRGAEFVNLQKGDIVFNHRQTEELLKNGYVTSGGGRAKVHMGYANGTAHLSGTAYAEGSADQAAKDALKELSNYFNWITINMDRLSRQSKLASNAIETAVTLNEKQAATSKAISKVQDERSGATQSADRYLQHAQWYAGESGLSADLQKRVQTGSVDISKYDENTQTKIKEYQQYYDKYLDMLDKATELQKKEADLAEKRLKNIEDAYKLVVKVSESLQDMNDAKLKYEEALGYSNVSDQVKNVYTESLNEAQSIYDNLLLELTDYKSEFSSLVKSGYIKEGSEQWNEALIKINNINKELSKTGKTIVEYQEKIRQTTYDKLENLIAGFERTIKSTDAKLSLSKARDENVSESVYQAQMNNNNGQIQGHMKLREEKLKELALYDVDSGKYQKIAKEINNLDKETYNLLSDNEKLKDSIFKLRFSPLDEALEKYQDLRSELGKFQGLLNKDAFFDKNGLITEEGLANLAILQQQMGAAKKEIADYQTGLDKLAESYTNGVISEKEYNDKSQDYRKGIREAAKDVVDYRDKLTDLYMTQMKTEVKALQEVIDKRKDALDAKADYYDYDKKLKSQTKDVNVLKAQIAAMEGVNDAATQAKVKQLKQQLANAEDKLSETKQDHSMDMQKQGYNGLSDDMEKMLDDTEYEIVHNSEKQQSVIESMLNNVVNMYQSAYGKINTIIAETGWVGSTDFNTGQTQLGTQTGAAAQTAGATQSQSSVASSGSATTTKTSTINNDDKYHKKTVETTLAKPENTTNRLVAEVKLSPTSVALEEGQSTTISIQSIRPSDAKNKGLSWKTENAQIASVSNGTIKGVSPGSCSIIASTTDGSNISASVSVTVTKKPDPPKPQPKPEPAKKGGDGIPNIGDAVTFADGIYYLDSYGTAPSGNQMKGQTVYITYMNPGAPYSIHISRTPRPGEHDLGWLSLNQIRGYKSGSKRIDQEQLAWTQENGRELIMRKTDGAMLTKLNPGDAIAPNNLTENLFKWGTVDPNTFLANAINTTTALPSMSELKQNITIEQHYDSLIHVDGNVDQDVLADLKSYEKDFLNKSYKYTTNMIAKDCQKVGIRRK